MHVTQPSAAIALRNPKAADACRAACLCPRCPACGAGPRTRPDVTAARIPAKDAPQDGPRGPLGTAPRHAHVIAPRHAQLSRRHRAGARTGEKHALRHGHALRRTGEKLDGGEARGRGRGGTWLHQTAAWWSTLIQTPAMAPDQVEKLPRVECACQSLRREAGGGGQAQHSAVAALRCDSLAASVGGACPLSTRRPCHTRPCPCRSEMRSRSGPYGWRGARLSAQH